MLDLIHARFRPLPGFLYSNGNDERLPVNYGSVSVPFRGSFIQISTDASRSWKSSRFRPLPGIHYSNHHTTTERRLPRAVSVPFQGSIIQILSFSLYINSAIIVSPAEQNIFLLHRNLETGSIIVKSLINTDAGQNLHSTRLIVHIPIWYRLPRYSVHFSICGDTPFLASRLCPCFSLIFGGSVWSRIRDAVRSTLYPRSGYNTVFVKYPVPPPR